MATAIETAALDRLLESLGRCLTKDSAEQVVALRADAKLQARLEELAEKSTEGALTLDERSEYETYIHAIDFITILQAKARIVLGHDRE